ncbi:SNF2-related protein [Ferviditalea candida]|uniref:SNF2-related protein n=1 Tax=Ferviditalea candida TaxID=3108399 RepID=A0ABU5ZGX8_9BACL|nr:SNF2-related protein [Paenibacillaceae bacterium T2]
MMQPDVGIDNGIKASCAWIADRNAMYLYEGALDEFTIRIKDPYELKTLLCGWHEASFYGSMLHVVRVDRQWRIVLDPYIALDYLLDPKPLQHAFVQWDERALLMREAAALFRDALTRGWFAPDWNKRLSPRPGWKLLLPAEQHSRWQRIEPLGAAVLSLWFEGILNQLVETEPGLSRIWPGLLQAPEGGPEDGLPAQMGNPAGASDAALAGVLREALSRAPANAPIEAVFRAAFRALLGESANAKAMQEASVNVSPDTDSSAASLPEGAEAAHPAAPSLSPEEEDWLIAIGWKQDPAPFTVSLQLVEPELAGSDEDAWKLRLLIQDKNESGTFAVCDLHGEPLEDPLPPAWGDFPASAAVKLVQRCLRIMPELQDPSRPGRMKEMLDEEEAWRFLDEDSLRLARNGISILLPAWWDTSKRTKPKLTAVLHSSVGSPKQSMFGLEHIVNFDWRMSIGDMELSEEEFRRIATLKKRFVHLRGRWIQLDPEYLAQLQRKLKQVSRTGLSFGDVLNLHLSGGGMNAYDSEEPSSMHTASLPSELKMEVQLNKHLRNLLKQLSETSQLPLIPAPVEFQGTLRNYQLQGASWLAFLHRYGLGGCLADDMGLGKTIQWIAYLLRLKQSGQWKSPALLICPTSVLGNWQKELQKFAPSLIVYMHYGSKRCKGEEFIQASQAADVVLTSYTLSHLDEAELSSLRWGSLCLDEAQNIKNAHTKQASSIRKLQADHRIALTGTPIENRLTELWSIFDFINPRYLGNLAQFKRAYVNPIEKNNDPQLISQVQKLIQPFLLRRLKKDPAIQLDLPEKNESKVYIALTAEQAALYDQVLQQMLERIDRLPPLERRGLILSTLTKLKQVCNHPSQLLKEPINRLRISGISGPTDLTAELNRSNKLSRLLEMVAELREEGDRCLIFTQFVEMGHLIEYHLSRQLNESVLFLHGGVPKSKRDQMIARFQGGSAEKTNPSASDYSSQIQPASDGQPGIFILSLKAGGIGLNLTAANHVFHFDRWWNPAVENQATDRAFRIGQTRNVQVHKFISLGTLEERIDEMIERKHGLSSQIVGTGEQWLTELSTGELREIFALRREWIEA